MRKSLVLSLILVIAFMSFAGAENNVTCTEDWQCGNWSECADDMQTKTCTDLNGCNTTTEKPEETQNCSIEECIENWTCTKWSDCVNETRARTCTDSNNCETSNEEPLGSKDCKPKRRLSNTLEECPENCICAGSTVKCNIDGGRQMIVYAGKSGNTIIQVKGINMTTKVTLYKENGTLVGEFKNNKTRKINFLPDEVKEKIKQRVHPRLENQTIELNDEGIYQIQAKKKARLFFLFPVRERVNIQMNSETGELVKIRNPWWGFLAKDSAE